MNGPALSARSPQPGSRSLSLLVCNCGPASVRLRWLEMPSEALLAEAGVEDLGSEHARVTVTQPGWGPRAAEAPIPDHRTGIAEALALLRKAGLDHVDAVAHKLTHGGDHFTGAMRIDAEVLGAMRQFASLAPLHNPANIAGVDTCAELLAHAPQYGVFETGFFDSLPDHASLYALPYHWATEFGIRRYGSHSASHRYVLGRAVEILGRSLEELRLISCHLGADGSSICAVRGGRAIAVSSGFTPQCGLVAATRAGDFDPGIVPYVMERLGLKASQVNAILNRESGLLGISGVSGDIGELESAAAGGDDRARLAIDIHNHAVRRYIGAYAVELGGLDVLAFTGGIGEGSSLVRAAICRDLEILGIHLDPSRNAACRGTEAVLSAGCWPVRVLALPADEEIVIARDVAGLIAAGE